MKVKIESEVAQPSLTLCDHMDCSLPGSSAHGVFQARVLEWVAIAFSAPALQADSLPADPLGKPKNTRVDSLSLVQRIFLTQELNQGLLHCRWILYQLSYQGSPWTHCHHLILRTLSNLANAQYYPLNENDLT